MTPAAPNFTYVPQHTHAAGGRARPHCTVRASGPLQKKTLLTQKRYSRPLKEFKFALKKARVVSCNEEDCKSLYF